MSLENLVTLREHLEAQISSLDERLRLHLALSQLAVDKASARMEDRLTSMNEFRDALRDRAGRFVTRAEMDLLHTSHTVDIQSLRESRAHLEGVAKMGAVYVGYVLSVAALLVAVLGVLSR